MGSQSLGSLPPPLSQFPPGLGGLPSSQTLGGSEDGSDEGSEDGSDEGSEDGSEEGSEDGSDEGSEDGSDEGSEEGSEDGSDEGSEDGSDEGSEDGSDEGLPPPPFSLLGSDDGLPPPPFSFSWPRTISKRYGMSNGLRQEERPRFAGLFTVKNVNICPIRPACFYKSFINVLPPTGKLAARAATLQA